MAKEELIQLNQSNLNSVVGISCDTSRAGSGTIISTEGIVLTNYHILDKAESCMVSIPNSEIGEPAYDYDAVPIITPLSSEYDIALLSINKQSIEEFIPTDFPTYTKQVVCNNSNFNLGSSLWVYGYPDRSGGTSLTVSVGIINSIDSENGDVLTSAQISSGNSGGIALDENGCFIGIPSTGITDGQYKDYGVVISKYKISKFLDDLIKTEPKFQQLKSILPTQ